MAGTAKYPGQMIVRCPVEIHAEIKATAKANRRSINAEIIHRLSTWSDGGVLPGDPNPQIRGTLSLVMELEVNARSAYEACKLLGIKLGGAE